MSKRSSVILRNTKVLLKQLLDDPLTSKDIQDAFEDEFFSDGESEEEYIEEIAEWRHNGVPPISLKNVVVFLETPDRIIIDLVPPDGSQCLNSIYAETIFQKLVEALSEDKEVVALDFKDINTGDGDEGCIYFEF